MISFYDLPYDYRFKVYDALKELQCDTRVAGGSGLLSVAVAKGRFSELDSALTNLGLQFVELYKFPLGSDKPPMHLRHESHGFPDSAWLIAIYRPIASQSEISREAA